MQATNKVSCANTMDDMMTENSNIKGLPDLYSMPPEDEDIENMKYPMGATWEKKELEKRLAVEKNMLKGKSIADRARLLK